MNVKVEYLSHSGYAVETDKIIMIFDYVNGILPSKYLTSDKQCCFFITHRHSDHFSQSVFSYKKRSLCRMISIWMPFSMCLK
jgi:ribonuclease BN (tRNA processing enzyme)